MSAPIRQRHNIDVNLTTYIEDELHNSVGVAEFKLSELTDQDADGSGKFGYDMFYDMTINDASGGGGTELVVNTDYLLLEPLPSDHLLVLAIFAATGLNVTIYTKLQIINAAYQGVDLFFTYYGVADDASAVDLNNVTNIILEESADFTVPELPGNKTYYITVGSSTISATLPVWEDNRNVEITFIIADDGTGTADILDDDEVTIIFQLWAGQGDHVTFKAGPSGWLNMTPKSWKYIRDKKTNFKSQITSWAGANNFSSYSQTLDWSDDLPKGSSVVKVMLGLLSATAWLYFRAENDTRVDNSPDTSPYEIANGFYGIGATGPCYGQIELPMSSDYKTEFVPASANTDVNISYPFGYYQ